MSKVREQLEKLVGQPRIVRLTRDFPSEPRHNGFVLGLGRELVLLQQFHDFYSEGYVALRLEDIKRTRSGQHERFFERMFRGEGLLAQVGIPYDVPLDGFRSLLGFFLAAGRNVIVECEHRDSPDEDQFLIGRILALGEHALSLLYFDPEGRWDEEPTLVPVDAITKVQFDTPYVNTLSKYLKRPRKPPPSNGRQHP